MAVTIVTTENFQKEVLESTQKVLVDFYADWCGPCQEMAPIFDALSQECSDVKFCKVNVDEQIELAKNFAIASIPTLMVFENGALVQRAVGSRAKDGILALLK